MWADRLALADMVNPVDKGNPSRLEQFDALLEEPLPRQDDWGDPENPAVAAGLESMMAMFGQPANN